MTNHGRLLTQNTDDKQNTINLNNKNMYIENAYERINRDRAEKDLNKLRTKDIYKDIKDNRERDKINAQNQNQSGIHLISPNNNKTNNYCSNEKIGLNQSNKRVKTISNQINGIEVPINLTKYTSYLDRESKENR